MPTTCYPKFVLSGLLTFAQVFMGYLVQVTAALLSLAFFDLGWSFELASPLALIALVPPPYLLAWLARRSSERGDFRFADRAERLLKVWPTLGQLAAVALFGWCEAISARAGWEPALTAWPGYAIFVGIAPFVVLEALAIDARARLTEAAGAGVRRARSFQLRLFLSALVPFGLYIAISSVVEWNETVRVNVEEVGLFGALFSVALIGLFLLILPTLLRHTWETREFAPGGLRQLFEDVARRAGFRCRGIYLWGTGGQMANAAIVGFTPRTRVVLFTDALIARLRPNELAAVFAHEIGHAKRHHHAIFLSFGGVLVLGAGVLSEVSGLDSGATLLAVYGAAFASWYVTFGYLSRRFELEADLECLEILGDADSLIDALEEISGGMHAREKTTWRHFSTKDRVEFLERVQQEPGVATRLRRRLRSFARVGYTAFAALLILVAVDLVRSFEEDRVVAFLRLGDYARAQERMDPTEDEGLIGVLDRVLDLPVSERTPDVLEAQGLEALHGGHEGEAGAWALLAWLRGRHELRPVLDTLEAPEAERARRLDELPKPWRAAFDERSDAP